MYHHSSLGHRVSILLDNDVLMSVKDLMSCSQLPGTQLYITCSITHSEKLGGGLGTRNKATSRLFSVREWRSYCNPIFDLIPRPTQSG